MEGENRENECVGEAGAEIRYVGDASTAVLRQLHGRFVEWEVASICWSAAPPILQCLQCLRSLSSGPDLSLFFFLSFTSCLIAKKDYGKEKEILFYFLCLFIFPLVRKIFVE